MAAILRARDIERLRHALGTTGHDAFCRALRNLLRARLRIDTFLVLRFAPHSRPELVAATLPATMAQTALTHYLDRAYRIDPFYLRTDVPPEGAMYRLADIAPDRFFASEYFVQYFNATRLVDEVGLLMPLGDGTTAHLSISRLERRGRYRAREIACLRHFSPLLLELLRSHFAHRAALAHPPDIPLPDLIRARGATSPGAELTAREGQIAALVLQGHSNASAALSLGIARETAKVHRRNIYRKLNISSQAELFALLKDLL